jgi:hypothetical protein
VSGPFFIVRRMAKRLRVPVANDSHAAFQVQLSARQCGEQVASSALTGELFRCFCPVCLGSIYLLLLIRGSDDLIADLLVIFRDV